MLRLPSAVFAVVLGAIVGVAAFAGWRLAVGGSDQVAGEESSTVTTSTSVVEVEAPWIGDGVRYETTVVIPITLTVADGTAEFEYLAETISPALDRHGEPVAGTPIDVLVRPERWVLEIEGGPPVEAITDADAGEVRFAVPDTATVDDVVAIHVDGWRRAVVVGEEAVLPLEGDAEAVLHDGTRLVLDTVLSQATSTIVQVGVVEPDDLWHSAGGFGFRLPDPRWRFSGGSAGGGFQVTWEGDDPPDEITIVKSDPEWVVVEDRVTVFSGGSG